jgi:hypothetical protein
MTLALLFSLLNTAIVLIGSFYRFLRRRNTPTPPPSPPQQPPTQETQKKDGDKNVNVFVNVT